MRLHEEFGLSVSSVQRIRRAFGLQPHRAETFKLSTDPLFVEKVRDVVGLHVAPPERAIVLCVEPPHRRVMLLTRDFWTMNLYRNRSPIGPFRAYAYLGYEDRGLMVPSGAAPPRPEDIPVPHGRARTIEEMLARA
jgi:hypothetical protein